MHAGVVVTDLDGTLLSPEREVGARDWAALEELGRRRVLRVVATGRSPFSARKVLARELPIDYLVHTSGAGVIDWASQEALYARHLEPPAAARLGARLVELGCDFMLHRAIPDNHQFYLHRSSARNDDFERRVELYAEYARELELAALGQEPMCQALVIDPPEVLARHAELQRELPEFNVIRATSPLDHRSTWLEVFPRGVSKALTATWLCQHLGRASGPTVAVGNDYNDLDLLEWAELPFVVANAPAELRARFPSVASNASGGFAEAIERALG